VNVCRPEMASTETIMLQSGFIQDWQREACDPRIIASYCSAMACALVCSYGRRSLSDPHACHHLGLDPTPPSQPNNDTSQLSQPGSTRNKTRSTMPNAPRLNGEWSKAIRDACSTDDVPIVSGCNSMAIASGCKGSMERLLQCCLCRCAIAHSTEVIS
jgi:hypothetical protein